MKEFTIEDIKVGATYNDLGAESQVKVTDIIEDQIYYIFLSFEGLSSMVGQEESLPARHFVKFYEPVYTVEGFEV